MLNYYRILGITVDASPEERTRAYRKRARETHPDARPDADPDDFVEVKAAYEALSDDEDRAEYHSDYQEYAKHLGCVVCPNCFAIVRVPPFSKHQVPKCSECKTRLHVTPQERDERYAAAFNRQFGELLQTLGVEGGALAKDAIRAGADAIRRKLGLGRSS